MVGVLHTATGSCNIISEYQMSDLVKYGCLYGIKSGITPQIGAEWQAGAIKPVRRASWEYAESWHSSSKELRELSLRAQVRVEVFSLVLCCGGFLSPASLTQCDEARRIEVQFRVSVSGRSVTHLNSPFSSPPRTLSRRATRGRALEPPCRCWALEDSESWCCRTVC